MRFYYAVSRIDDDRWPIEFRGDCERTRFDVQTGKDRSLVEVIMDLDRRGYDLFFELPERFRKKR